METPQVQGSINAERKFLFKCPQCLSDSIRPASKLLGGLNMRITCPKCKRRDMFHPLYAGIVIVLSFIPFMFFDLWMIRMTGHVDNVIWLSVFVASTLISFGLLLLVPLVPYSQRTLLRHALAGLVLVIATLMFIRMF